MPRAKRQTEIPDITKPQPAGIDDELVVEVHELTEAWQAAGLKMRQARVLLLAQMEAAKVDHYETHDGFSVTVKPGKDRLSVLQAKQREPDA